MPAVPAVPTRRRSTSSPDGAPGSNSRAARRGGPSARSSTVPADAPASHRRWRSRRASWAARPASKGMTTSTGATRASARSSAHWPGTRSSNPATVTAGNASRSSAAAATDQRASLGWATPLHAAAWISARAVDRASEATARTRSGGTAATRSSPTARSTPVRNPGALADAPKALRSTLSSTSRRARRVTTRLGTSGSATPSAAATRPRRAANVTASRPMATPPPAASRRASAAASREGTTSRPPSSAHRCDAYPSAAEKAGARVNTRVPGAIAPSLRPLSGRAPRAG